MASGLDLNQPPDDVVEISVDDDRDSSDDDDEMETNGGLGIDLNMHPDEDEDLADVDQQHNSNTHHHQNGQQGQHQPNNGRPPTHHKRKNRLSTEQRFNLLIFLLKNSDGDNLNDGAIKQAMQQFNSCRRTVSKLWHDAKKQKAETNTYNPCTKYHLAGRKRVQIPEDAISKLSIGQRTCIRDLAETLQISRSTVLRMIQRGDLKPHTNPLKPKMSEANKITRLKWILGLLMGSTPWTKTRYYPMYDFVHIDEKWFNLTKKSQRYYLARSEKGTHRTGQSSTKIPKAMFVSATARPRFREDGRCYFDGRFGIFPFTFQEPAKRNSKYREKGTMVTKVVESITKETMRRMLIDKIVPAIKAKWPNDGTSKTIYIQQDNCRTHILQDDPEWQQVYQQGEFTFILIQQPPNSPDLNILDLGFFNSIQTLQHKKMPKNVDELLAAVNQAYYELEPQTLCFVWVTLQAIMNEVLKVKGGNDYTNPHMNKEKLLREGKLEERLHAPNWAVLKAWEACYGDIGEPPIDLTEDEGMNSTQRQQHVTPNDIENMQAHVNEGIIIEEEDNMEYTEAYPDVMNEELAYWASQINEEALWDEAHYISKYGTKACANDHEASSSKQKK